MSLRQISESLLYKNLLIIPFDVIYVFIVKQLTFSKMIIINVPNLLKSIIIVIKYYSFLLRLRILLKVID